MWIILNMNFFFEQSRKEKTKTVVSISKFGIYRRLRKTPHLPMQKLESPEHFKMKSLYFLFVILGLVNYLTFTYINHSTFRNINVTFLNSTSLFASNNYFH